MGMDLPAELGIFYEINPFLLERGTDRLVIQSWIFGKYFLEKEQRRRHFEERSCQYLLLLIKFEFSRKKSENSFSVERICIVHLEFSNFTVLKRLLIMLVMILIRVTF